MHNSIELSKKLPYISLLFNQVVLLGGHTVGVAHCGFFRDRLFNFQGSGKPDPTMDPTLRTKLIRHCGATPKQKDPEAFLDQGSSFSVDNQYYNQIAQHRGVMLIDQELALDDSTAGIVAALRKDKDLFMKKFGAALVKLGGLHVLEGKAGEIRKTCGVVNGGSQIFF